LSRVPEGVLAVAGIRASVLPASQVVTGRNNKIKAVSQPAADCAGLVWLVVFTPLLEN